MAFDSPAALLGAIREGRQTPAQLVGLLNVSHATSLISSPSRRPSRKKKKKTDSVRPRSLSGSMFWQTSEELLRSIGRDVPNILRELHVVHHSLAFAFLL